MVHWPVYMLYTHTFVQITCLYVLLHPFVCVCVTFVECICVFLRIRSSFCGRVRVCIAYRTSIHTYECIPSNINHYHTTLTHTQMHTGAAEYRTEHIHLNDIIHTYRMQHVLICSCTATLMAMATRRRKEKWKDLTQVCKHKIILISQIVQLPASFRSLGVCTFRCRRRRFHLSHRYEYKCVCAEDCWLNVHFVSVVFYLFLDLYQRTHTQSHFMLVSFVLYIDKYYTIWIYPCIFLNTFCSLISNGIKWTEWMNGPGKMSCWKIKDNFRMKDSASLILESNSE